ncbi:MAG: tape measure protein, partial [Hungatella sp.]
MAYYDLQMFAADGHLNFDTKLDTKGFTGGISKLGSLAKGGLALLGGAVAGVTSAMGAGVAAGMKYNSDMQNYFSNFETMLGSAQVATDHVNQLKEFAAKTPFEMSDLANASKTLLAFGTDSVEVMPIMKQLGDISLGNKDKFNSLALVYGQVSSQGKMMGQDLLQMINAGFNPLLEISRHTGESMESLKDKMSKGQIGVEELDRALQWATEDGGQFAGGMEKASKTFDGVMSTLKDNAMSLLGEVVQPLTEGMTDTLLPAAIEAIDGLSKAFKDGGAGSLIEAGAGLLADVLVGISKKAPEVIGTAITFITTLIQSLNDNTEQLVEAGGQLIDALLAGLIELVPSLAEFGWNIVSTIIKSITENAPAMSEQGTSILTSLMDGLTSGSETLLTTGTQLIATLASSISSALPQLMPVAIKTILGFAQNVVNNLPALVDSGLQMLQAVAEGIASSLPTIIEMVPKLINSFADAVYSSLPKILAAGVKILITLGKGIIDSIPTIIANAGEIIKAIINVISLVNLASLGKSLINTLINGIKGMKTAIAEAGGNLATSLINKIRSTNWIDVGKNIIMGIVNGVRNNAKKLVEAAAGAVTDALNWVKEKLGIHSPSKVFQDEVGKNIALGVAEGINQNKEHARKSAEELAQLTLDAAKKKLDNHKVYNRLSLADEVAYWDGIRKQVKEGTQARIDADKEYLSVKENLDSQMLKLDQDYADKTASAYKNLNKRIQSLNEQYQNSVDQRTSQITSSFGLFDEFDVTTDLSANDLLNNLQSQVDGLNQWRGNLKDLDHRGISDALLAELEELGPKAAAEIQLMTEMSDDQLDEYAKLFGQKNRIARKQAVAELEPMREEISGQIAQMQSETAADLAKYQQEYIASMMELGVALNQPLETMKLTASQNAVALVTTM